MEAEQASLDSSADSSAFTFQDVSKSVTSPTGRATEILTSITADIPAGSVVALVGPSGAGKSTLLSLCNALDSPTSGHISVLGKDIAEWDVQALRRRVGLVFQTPTMLPGTVEDNLRAAAKIHNEPSYPLDTYLESVSLSSELLKRPAADLSGGQQQRVALARTLVAAPQVLLLDEVTSSLDIAAAQVVEDAILRIHEAKSVTLLWITHDLDQAGRVADIVWLMVDGRVVEQTACEAFFTSPATELGRRFIQGEL
jgi:putative ABC transport system ATP-binding protein